MTTWFFFFPPCKCFPFLPFCQLPCELFVSGMLWQLKISYPEFNSDDNKSYTLRLAFCWPGIECVGEKKNCLPKSQNNNFNRLKEIQCLYTDVNEANRLLFLNCYCSVCGRVPKVRSCCDWFFWCFGHVQNLRCKVVKFLTKCCWSSLCLQNVSEICYRILIVTR